jgi:hypothetical protein
MALHFSARQFMTLLMVMGLALGVFWIRFFFQVTSTTASSTPDQTRPAPVLQVLRIPQDVDWFIPNKEGWLCDYKYIERKDDASGSLITKLQILPRNTGLGKIMVYLASESLESPFVLTLKPISGQAMQVRKDIFMRSFRCQSYDGHCQSNDFLKAFFGRNPQMSSGEWVVAAINSWGQLDRMFATSAQFGEETAFVSLSSTFHLNQEIPLRKIGDYRLANGRLVSAKEFSSDRVGTDETVHAYS